MADKALLLMGDAPADRYLALQPDGAGVVVFDPATGAGAECCCGGTADCCMFDGGTSGCRVGCCSWGSDFTLTFSGASTAFCRRYFGLPVESIGTATRTVTCSFSVRFRCVDGVWAATCLGFDFDSNLVCPGPLNVWNRLGHRETLKGCAQMDLNLVNGCMALLFAGNPAAFGRPGLFDSITGSATTLGSGGQHAPCVGGGDQPCSFSCVTDCGTDINTGAPVRGTASRAFAASCLAYSWSAADDRPRAWAGGNDQIESHWSGSGTATITRNDDKCPCPPMTCEQFLNCFEQGLPCADLNGDGFIDPLDYAIFMNQHPDCSRTGGKQGQRVRLMVAAGVRLKVRR